MPIRGNYFKRHNARPLAVGLLLSAIAFFISAPTLLNRQSPAVTNEDVTLPEPARAIVTDPVTRAVTLEVIDSR